MADDAQVEFRGDHVYVRDTASNSFADALRLWNLIARTCEKHRCYRILGESHTTVPSSVAEHFQYIELFKRVGITIRHRIAWVPHTELGKKEARFIETVLQNRGLVQSRLFETVEEARQWLLSDATPAVEPDGAVGEK